MKTIQNRLQNFSLSQNDWPLLWAPCVWIHSWNQIMAENYLNSYFKNSYSRESNIIAEFESGTRTYKSNYTGLKSEQTRNTLICLFMRFRATFYCSLFSQRTRVNKYPLFHSNTLCFTNKNAISQITVFSCIYSGSKVRNTLLSLVWFSD